MSYREGEIYIDTTINNEIMVRLAKSETELSGILEWDNCSDNPTEYPNFYFLYLTGSRTPQDIQNMVDYLENTYGLMAKRYYSCLLKAKAFNISFSKAFN